MRKKIIIGNWKMFKNGEQTNAFFENFQEQTSTNLVVGIAAPYTNLHHLQSAKAKFSTMMMGAQNCHFEAQGAFTGEISTEMLQDFNLDFCLVGHSERRTYFNETNETINLKMKALLAKNMMPVLCVGETLEEFESGQTLAVIKTQLDEALVGIESISQVVVAYEPVWAIGTGKSASEAIAQDICKAIREHLAASHGQQQADELLIQYGGSVNNDNIVSYLSQPDVDGALIGSASLDPLKFVEILAHF